MDGDGDGVGRVPVGLLGRRRGRQLGLAPRGLEHVLGVVEDLQCKYSSLCFLVKPSDLHQLHPVHANQITRERLHDLATLTPSPEGKQ